MAKKGISTEGLIIALIPIVLGVTLLILQLFGVSGLSFTALTDYTTPNLLVLILWIVLIAVGIFMIWRNDAKCKRGSA